MNEAKRFARALDREEACLLRQLFEFLLCLLAGHVHDFRQRVDTAAPAQRVPGLSRIEKVIEREPAEEMLARLTQRLSRNGRTGLPGPSRHQ